MTISSVIAAFNGLMDDCENYSKATCPVVQTAARLALEVLNKYYSKTNESYIVCLILDPRFKLVYYEFDTSPTAEDPANMKKIFLKTYQKYKANKVTGGEVATNPQEDSSLDRMWRHQAKRSKVEETEATMYLSEDIESPTTNPLDYWKLRESRFPVLASMARDYLAVPATSCPSERLFSTAGNVISASRSRLNPDTVRALLCLKSWSNSGLFPENK